MTPEQIQLVERSGVKMPEAALTHYERDYRLQITGEKHFYTTKQLHAVIAEMQEKLEASEKDVARFKVLYEHNDFAYCKCYDDDGYGAYLPCDILDIDEAMKELKC